MVTCKGYRVYFFYVNLTFLRQSNVFDLSLKVLSCQGRWISIVTCLSFNVSVDWFDNVNWKKWSRNQFDQLNVFSV